MVKEEMGFRHHGLGVGGGFGSERTTTSSPCGEWVKRLRGSCKREGGRVGEREGGRESARERERERERGREWEGERHAHHEEKGREGYVKVVRGGVDLAHNQGPVVCVLVRVSYRV